MKHGKQPVEVRADLLSDDDSDFGKLNDIFNFRPTEECLLQVNAIEASELSHLNITCPNQ